MSVREIGADAFNYCERLKSVQLNEGLKKLGTKEIINGKEYEGGVFARCALQNIQILSSLKGIEAGISRGCRNRQSIEIPNGVEQMGKRCFDVSDIEEITLPGSLKEISKGAFEGLK